MSILVVGCGGIGGTLMAGLLEAGQPIACAAKRPRIAEALSTHGVRVLERGQLRRIPGQLHVFVEPPQATAFDFILLAVQPDSVEEAARAASTALAPGGVMVTCQNGLCEERVARIVGEERVIGAVIAFGASSPEPGVYERTSSGGVVLGRLSGKTDEKVETLARLLEPVGPVRLTNNLRGARWSKLALNCAVSSLGTIAGERLGRMLMHRFARRLALEVMTEVVHVARAEGVHLEKVANTVDLEWLALTADERSASPSLSLATKHALVLAVGARYQRLRSSLLAAIERGRTPSVDFLNGEVVERARRHELPTPVNAEVQRLVHAIAQGHEKSSVATLRALYDNTVASRQSRQPSRRPFDRR